MISENSISYLSDQADLLIVKNWNDIFTPTFSKTFQQMFWFNLLS